MSIELKPDNCPFCGPTGWRVVANKQANKGSSSGFWWTVRCGVCRTYGPRAHTEAEAIAKWNKRTTNNEGEQ